MWRSFLFWLVFNVPLGPLAPHVFGWALGIRAQYLGHYPPDTDLRTIPIPCSVCGQLRHNVGGVYPCLNCAQSGDPKKDEEVQG